jgi:uncharacterized protein with HEPN domain
MSRASDHLRHALDACERIDEYTRNQTLAGFLGSRMLQDAVLRNFEVLGEADARAVLRAAEQVEHGFEGE